MVLRYLRFYQRRLDGAPEDKIASEEGFRSPQALYERLALEGFPVCTVCGETPEKPGHCEKPGSRRRRRANTDTGTLVKLPSANAARDLFLDALEGLKVYVDSLDIEEDWLWGTSAS
jgi:hypothetical protein